MENYSKLSKIILGFVGFAFLFLILQQIIINPLKIGRDFSPDDINWDDPIIYERYIKHKYLINHINNYDSFIIGASAASNIRPENQLGGKWYAYTGAYMNLFETKRFLQEIISKRQIKNLIITISDENLKIDEISSYKEICNVRPGFEYYPLPQSLEEKLFYYSKNFFSIPTLSIIQRKIESLQAQNQDFQPKPISELTQEEIKEMLPVSSLEILPERFEEIKEINDLAKENNINIIFVYIPEYIKVYNVAAKKNIENKIKIAKIVPFYDFSGANEINNNPKNYMDLIHFNDEVGNLVLDRIFNQDKNNPPKIKNFGNYYKLNQSDITK